MTDIVPDTDTRTCNKCGQSKPLTEFYINGPSKGGRMGVCRDCNNRARRLTAAKVIRNRATMRTYRALAQRHRDEYDRLLADELEKARAEHAAVQAAAAARGNDDADIARLKPGPLSQDLGETSTLERLDVARCPSCHQHHDRGHACPTCGEDTTEPTSDAKRPRDVDIDWAVVERRLAGDKSVPMNTGERREIVARARARGMSLLDITHLTGIGKPERYLPDQGGVA